MIKIQNGLYQDFKFPAGEQHVVVSCDSKIARIEFTYEDDAEIFKLLLICNALKGMGKQLGTLFMPYVPHGRQDRVTQPGEPFSIKVFCGLINALKFKEVIIYDAHSLVTTSLLHNCFEVQQDRLFLGILHKLKEYYLICPDGGALKKVNALAANSCPIDVIECSKKRNTKTGEITETKVWHTDFGNKTCVIVDDICDGGRTFIEIAKVLKKRNAGKIILCVTHGFFTKGLEVFNGLIDEIYTRERKVK